MDGGFDGSKLRLRIPLIFIARHGKRPDNAFCDLNTTENIFLFMPSSCSNIARHSSEGSSEARVTRDSGDAEGKRARARERPRDLSIFLTRRERGNSRNGELVERKGRGESRTVTYI